MNNIDNYHFFTDKYQYLQELELCKFVASKNQLFKLTNNN